MVLNETSVIPRQNGDDVDLYSHDSALIESHCSTLIQDYHILRNALQPMRRTLDNAGGLVTLAV